MVILSLPHSFITLFTIVWVTFIRLVLSISNVTKSGWSLMCTALSKHRPRVTFSTVTSSSTGTTVSTTLGDYDQLPDVCLFRVYSQLSVYDLLHAGAVCRRWKHCQESVLRFCKSLTILIGDEAADYLTDTSTLKVTSDLEDSLSVYFTRLDNVAIRRLLLNFPNIEHLSISISPGSSKIVRKIAFLLSKWSPKLLTLKIYAKFCHHSKDTVISGRMYHLLESINALPNVKCLTLQLHNTFISYDHCSYVKTPMKQIDLPILARLHEFNFYSADHATFLVDSFQRYAVSNGALKTICLYNHIGRNRTWEKYLELDEELLCRFRQVRFHLGLDNVNSFAKLVPRFTSVTHCRIYIEKEMPYREILGSLSAMPQLSHLDIEINNESSRRMDTEDLENVPQLCGVTNVTLHVSVFSHRDDLSFFLVDRVFPQLQLLTVPFYVFQCEDCAYLMDDYFTNTDEEDDDEDDVPASRDIENLTKEEKKHCATALVEPLKPLTKIPMVITFEWPGDTEVESYEDIFGVQFELENKLDT